MSSAFATAGKKALLDAIVGHNFKAALYTSSATLDATTAAYSATNELAAANGYSTGGVALTGAATGSGSGTAWLDFADATWTTASFTGARFMLIYDTNDSNRAYAVIDFGADKAAQGGSFIYEFPVADAANAIIRI
jgi:hypothetical protein